MKTRPLGWSNLLKRVLVVGGTGFIGTNFCKAASEEFVVYSLSKNKRPKEKELLNVNYVYCDLRNKEKLRHSLDKEFSHVINFGGYVDHTNFSDSGLEVLETHFGGLANLLSVLDISSIESFINIGSSDEYWGNISPMHESFIGEAFSCYSLSKKLSNEFLKYMYTFEGLKALSVRLFLTYGPGQSVDRFLPQVINSCLKNESFDITPGDQIRDFTYIDDVVHGLILAMKSKNCFGETLNLASGKPIKIREVVNQVVDIIGKGKPVFGGMNYRENEQMDLYADISKIQSKLNWTPSIDLESGLLETIQSYK